MQGTEAHACPNCLRSFKGTQGPGHEHLLQPRLLRCGHTFCQGCISKQLKVLKTSIVCPNCQVVTPMPLGNASIQQLPANYYTLGLASWNSNQVMDMLDQKIQLQLSCKASYKGVQLEGERKLCQTCHRALAICHCQQCEDFFCEACFLQLHRGSRTLQTHTAVPLDSSKGHGGCKEHDDRDFEFFCQEEKVPICALCAVIGTHKGHNVIRLSEQDKEACKELKSVYDTAKNVLKHQYYAKQMTKDAKRDVRKELTDLAYGVRAFFARLHAVLQLREHALLEQTVGVYAQQAQYYGSVLTNVEGNICILEAAMIDALPCLEDESTMPVNITQLVHTLKSSQTLPCHIVVPTSDKQQSLINFTCDSHLASNLASFGAIKVNSEPRLELKTDLDVPEDWKPPEISDDVLNNSAINNYKKDKDHEKVVSPKSQTKTGSGAMKQFWAKVSPQSESKPKECKLMRSRPSPKSTHVFGNELVKVTHIRNPCCFYIQRESDQSQLSCMMVRMNKECKTLPKSKRLPQDLSIDSLCCCLYDTDKTWYRVRIKSFIYPDPEGATPMLTPPTSPYQTPTQSTEVCEDHAPPQSDPDTSKDAMTHEVTDSLSDIKSEIESEVGSETSCEMSQDVVFEVKSTIKEDVKPKTKIDEVKVEVLYVDYGNSETVSLSKLCRLKPKHCDIPDLAVCCSLTDIVPTHKSVRWSADAVYSFAKMVGDKSVYMSILGHSGATLYVDLHKPPLMEIQNDMPVSLRDAMVFLELACFVSPESVPKTKPSRGPPLKFIPVDLPTKGEEILVTVSHFQDPQRFYVQEIGADYEYLLNMMKELQETYSKNLEDSWNILCPRKGDICVALFTEDNQWTRAEIVDLPGNQEVDVLYVDYGNYERIHCSKLRKIAKQFVKLSMQAVPCSLEDIGPNDAEKGWTNQETEGFGILTLKKSLRATVKGIEKGRLSLILMEETQDSEINVNALMVQKGYADSTGPGSVSAAIIFDNARSNFPDDEPLPDEDTQFSDAVTTVRPIVPNTKSAVLPFGSTCPPKSQLSPKLSSQYTVVHISHVESPACIYIQLSTAGKDGLDSLLEAMTLTYKQMEIWDDVIWQEGALCSALLVREGAWCRGKVKTILPENNAVILFTDYGNTEVVSFHNIHPLLEKFQKDAPFAIQCHLADVIPGGDKQKWTKTACEFLAAMLSDLECVIVKKGDLENGSLPIDLLYGRSVQEKLEQQTLEDFGSISKLLQLKGLALPVKRTPSTSQTLPSLLSCNKPSNSLENAKMDDFPRYQSPRLPTSTTIDLVVTYVNPNGIICGLKLIEVESFRNVMEKLQVANAIRQPIPTATQLHKGQAICAQFQEDKLWYRAEVIVVNTDTVEVRYVDFGNSEVVPLANIHLKPFMLDMPQQSRDCSLIGIKPKSPNTSWPASAIQFLLENLVEQTCTAHIKSLCKEGEALKVNLMLPNNQSITNLLLDKGFAETDEQDVTDQCMYSGDDKSMYATVVTSNGSKASPDMTMASQETEYQPMELPPKGSRLAVYVTHINQPNMIYIQPCVDQLHTEDPVLLETYRQSVQLRRVSSDLNKIAPTLPYVTDPQPGLCCCTLDQVNQQWFRTVIRQVKEAEKLCEVQFVDYGTLEWVPTKCLRQIPQKFTTLPMQARLCKLIGLQPPSPSATNHGATLSGSDWPMAAVDMLLELVSNKQLIASIQYQAAIPGIFLNEVSGTTDQAMKEPQQTGHPIHLALIEAGLAQLVQETKSEEKLVEKSEM